MKLKKLFVFALSLLTLTACGGKATGEVTSSSSSSVELDAKGMEVLRFDDVVEGKETYYAGFPKNYGKTSEKKGTLEKLDYVTTVYGEDHVFNKYVNVYLPYGYNQNDTTKKYNVIYMEHGNKRSVDDLVHVGEETQFQRELDNLFDPDKAGIDPAIVVFTTFYMDELRVTAGDTQQEELPPNFYLEVRNDIVPLVETHYNTYLTENSDAALKASRSHRAFTGYSRGSCCTWAMMIQNFEYFQYYSPMSATSVGTMSMAEAKEKGEEAVWEQHKAVLDAHPELPYFVYCGGGKKEAAERGLTSFVNLLVKKTDYFHWTNQPDDKGLFYAVSKLEHHDEYATTYYYNSLKCFFQSTAK